jgi:hypothetical protein
MKTISHKLDRELKKAKRALRKINELFIKEFRDTNVPPDGAEALGRIAKAAKKIRQTKRTVQSYRAR